MRSRYYNFRSAMTIQNKIEYIKAFLDLTYTSETRSETSKIKQLNVSGIRAQMAGFTNQCLAKNGCFYRNTVFLHSITI